MTEFSPEQLEALFAAILVNDVVDAKVDLPDTIRVDYPASHIRDGFAISRQLWEQGFDPDALIELASDLRREGAEDVRTQTSFKHARAKFKHLRFAFVLYDSRHRCPLVFKTFTTTMGLLQDSLRVGQTSMAARHAAVLGILLSHIPQRLLRREADQAQMADPTNFRAFTLSQVAALRAFLKLDRPTGHKFHAARKIVSRQESFHDDMRIVHPSLEHVHLSRFLSAINGLMGRHHDHLLAKRGHHFDYFRDEIALPYEIRSRLTVLLERYPA